MGRENQTGRNSAPAVSLGGRILKSVQRYVPGGVPAVSPASKPSKISKPKSVSRVEPRCPGRRTVKPNFFKPDGGGKTKGGSNADWSANPKKRRAPESKPPEKRARGTVEETDIVSDEIRFADAACDGPSSPVEDLVQTVKVPTVTGVEVPFETELAADGEAAQSTDKGSPGRAFVPSDDTTVDSLDAFQRDAYSKVWGRKVEASVEPPAEPKTILTALLPWSTEYLDSRSATPQGE